jgi:hypothetical protein
MELDIEVIFKYWKDVIQKNKSIMVMGKSMNQGEIYQGIIWGLL